MRQCLQFIFLACVLVALLSAVNGLPWGGPASNRESYGGPAWNGGMSETTDNIILHSNGKWRNPTYSN